MDLTVHVPDDVADRLRDAGVNPERLALDALYRAAGDLGAIGAVGVGPENSGELLIAALQASPARDLDIMPSRGPLPVRSVEV